MCSGNDFRAVGITALHHVVGVAPGDIYRPVRQLLQTIAGHLGRVGHSHTGDVEIEPDPFHRRSARDTQYQLEHIDTVLA